MGVDADAESILSGELAVAADVRAIARRPVAVAVGVSPDGRHGAAYFLNRTGDAWHDLIVCARHEGGVWESTGENAGSLFSGEIGSAPAEVELWLEYRVGRDYREVPAGRSLRGRSCRRALGGRCGRRRRCRADQLLRRRRLRPGKGARRGPAARLSATTSFPLAVA